MHDASLAQMFFSRAKRSGQRAALRTRRGTGFVDTSYAQVQDEVLEVAAALIARGVGVGDKVALYASTSARWIAADFAILAIGAVTIPIYPSVTAEEAGFIIHDAGAKVVIAEHAGHLDKLRSVKGGFRFLDVDYDVLTLIDRPFIIFESAGIDAADDWQSYASVRDEGRGLLNDGEGHRDEIAARTASLSRETLATITYTSGTTGAPKGVLQTHGNWLAMLDVASALQLFTERTRDTGAFLFLPLAHAFGRLVAFGGVYFESVVVVSSPETLLVDLQDSRPGFVPAAPRVYEKIYARMMNVVAEQKPARQRLFHWALSVGEATIPYRERGVPLPTSLGLQYALADRLIFSKVRARLGLDRVQVMLSGSAALSPTVLRFFLSMNILLVEAYGLTETCPGISSNRPDRFRAGSVGPLVPGVDVRFEEDGEICARGANITSGYHNRPDDNARAFADGWFRTGDIGHLDTDGFLFITDRKKDLLKTSGGKYVAPQKIEGLLKGRPPVTEAVVIGDGKNYCTALIVIDDDAIAAWAARTGNPAERQHPAFVQLVGEQVKAVNDTLASYESIKYFRIVDDVFTVDNGLLTASFKVKRKAVSERYRDLIDSMYA